MLKTVTLFAFAIYQISAGAVELLPTAQVAPVAPAVVTSRSSQYFAQNHNALAAPAVAPYVAQYVAPASATVSQVARYSAPVAQYVAPAVAPVARYIAPAAASYSQVARYVSPVTQYIAPISQYVAAAPLVQANFAAVPAPLVASPVLTRAPLAVATAQPVPVAQPVAVAQPVPVAQPVGPQLAANPPVQAQSPDDDSIEIESARISLPQTRNQPQRVAGSQQRVPVAGFPSFPPQNLALAQQDLVTRFQQQNSQQNVQNARLSTAPAAQVRNQLPQNNIKVSGRNVAQEQQAVPRNGALIAAPGLLSAQQYFQGPYFG